MWACCWNAWSSGLALTVERFDETGKIIYTVHGQLFFGSVTSFLAAFDSKNDPQEVTVRFEHSGIGDFSGLEALNTLIRRYHRVGKRAVGALYACVSV